jgi:hypothetical protein
LKEAKVKVLHQHEQDPIGTKLVQLVELLIKCNIEKNLLSQGDLHQHEEN